MQKILTPLLPFGEYHIRFTQRLKPDGDAEEVADAKFNNPFLLCVVVGAIIGKGV